MARREGILVGISSGAALAAAGRLAALEETGAGLLWPCCRTPASSYLSTALFT